MILAAKTDRGLKRDNNQDSYSFGELTTGACYAIVCDGMGGAAEGATASRECARIVRERITNGYHDGMSDISIKSLLYSAVEYANKYIYSISLSDERYEGMGTTVVASIITDGFIYTVHAGDSRAYLINPEENRITQLTRDHSVVQKMIEDGEITEKEAVNHPKKNLITRAVGVENTVRADFCQEDVSPGDMLLICTDGLSNYLTADEILQVASDRYCEECINELVRMALRKGGSDNVTAVAVKI